jgi:hypothetical protein
LDGRYAIDAPNNGDNYSPAGDKRDNTARLNTA